MTFWYSDRQWAGLITMVVALGISPVLGAAEVKDSLEVVSGTNRSAAQTQEKIDQLSRETRDLLEEYRKLKDGSEYQAAYTRELEQLDQAQQAQIEELRALVCRDRPQAIECS